MLKLDQAQSHCIYGQKAPKTQSTRAHQGNRKERAQRSSREGEASCAWCYGRHLASLSDAATIHKQDIKDTSFRPVVIERYHEPEKLDRKATIGNAHSVALPNG